MMRRPPIATRTYALFPYTTRFRSPRKAADARPGVDVFANRNAALARTGVTLRIVAGTDVATPLHLVFIGAPSDADRAWHLRHAVDVGEGASLVLAEHHLADGTHRHLDTAAQIGRAHV